ncbi:MAG: hypothetical protein H0T46_27285 [Deltaproteobacteria bacterium]|nr:hypothetical protein [Deltaproteobacteria bacterium]
MDKATALLIGSALGVGFCLWQYSRPTPPPSSPTTTPPFRGLASLHEVAELRAALTRNAKRSTEHGEHVTVVAHHRSWPGTSLRHR